MTVRRVRVGRRALAGIGVLVFAAIVAASADAYRIVYPHIHEQMTWAAEACLKDAGRAAPDNCLAHYEGLPGLTTVESKIVLSTPDQNRDLGLASRWPDDPTLQIAPRSIVKYLVTMEEICPGKIKANRNLDVAGLLCSSHYGDLQFMHAQASRGEDFRTTRQKILDWAAFAFDVAVGKIEPTAPFCTTLRDRASTISTSMVPDGFQYCDDRTGRLGTPYRGWRVSTFFTMKCRRAFVSGRCPEPPTDQEARELTIVRAKGALMHLIQDSFSQSHVRRGQRGRIGAAEAYVSKIVCLPGTEFYDYEKQVAAKEDHKAADYPPSLDSVSCGPGSTIHDPITASAMTLWHIEEARLRGEGHEKFLAYFRKHVLGCLASTPTSDCG